MQHSVCIIASLSVGCVQPRPSVSRVLFLAGARVESRVPVRPISDPQLASFQLKSRVDIDLTHDRRAVRRIIAMFGEVGWAHKATAR